MAKEQEQLLHIYGKLNSYFGPRNWWPGETRLEIIIGAILTQSVAWRNVEKAIDNLKEYDWLGSKEETYYIQRIQVVSFETLGELIRPTRYFNQKAKKIKAFISHLTENYQGNIDLMFQKSLAELRKELLAIWGIGEETADSIILYAAAKPIFVVDAYTKRIYNRIGLFKEDITYREMQVFFMSHLSEDLYLFNQYHAIIDGLGNRICLAKKPLCADCPINSLCQTGQNNVNQ